MRSLASPPARATTLIFQVVPLLVLLLVATASTLVQAVELGRDELPHDLQHIRVTAKDRYTIENQGRPECSTTYKVDFGATIEGEDFGTWSDTITVRSENCRQWYGYNHDWSFDCNEVAVVGRPKDLPGSVVDLFCRCEDVEKKEAALKRLVFERKSSCEQALDARDRMGQLGDEIIDSVAEFVYTEGKKYVDALVRSYELMAPGVLLIKPETYERLRNFKFDPKQPIPGPPQMSARQWLTQAAIATKLLANERLGMNAPGVPQVRVSALRTIFLEFYVDAVFYSGKYLIMQNNLQDARNRWQHLTSKVEEQSDQISKLRVHLKACGSPQPDDATDACHAALPPPADVILSLNNDIQYTHDSFSAAAALLGDSAMSTGRVRLVSWHPPSHLILAQADPLGELFDDKFFGALGHCANAFEKLAAVLDSLEVLRALRKHPESH